jgi:hypothetical protein
MYHVWNSNETLIQVGKQSRANVLVKRGSNVVYSTIPKSWEWLTINYAVSVLGVVY